KPLAVGRAAHAHVLGLPGNPASASLTFLLFGVPLLRALQGDARPLPPRFDVEVELAAPIARDAGRMEFLRARLDAAGRRARVLPNQSSGAVTSFAEADALVVVPAERTRVEPGDVLDAIRLADV
ncbi:MAG TPA: molybdopterin molybdenumtransferase MoeA, partial [Minicystis sp.]|nr:molybdopterin molybdenumtransferase MoeA [Minicystis sp.]